MARTLVSSIMNPHLFSVRTTDTCGDVLQALLFTGLTAAPVLDDRGEPMGVVSIRDLVGAPTREAVLARMRQPTITARPGESVEDAADRLGHADLHHLVVVDEVGRAVGVVGSLDVIRGMRGQPRPHPKPTRPPSGELTGPLTPDAAGSAPAAPAILELIPDGSGNGDVRWTAVASNLRTRLCRILEMQDALPAELAHARAQGTLQFQARLLPAMND